MVGNISDLVSLEGASGLQVDWLGAEPEELLGEDQVPAGGQH